MNEENQDKANYIYYSLGVRDSIAGVLAKYKDKIKLPELAKEYEQMNKEKHFSHQWHTS